MRKPIVVALMCAAALLAGPGASARAEAAGRGPASILVEGRGYGHGRGLGQWGARGMAASGATWRRILHHYYTGVRISTLRQPPVVRVLLRHAGTVVVSAGARFDLATAAGRRIATLPGGTLVRLRRLSGPTTIERAGSLAGPWRSVGARWDSVVVSARSARVRLVERAGAVRFYRGSLEVRRSGFGALYAINRVALDDYLLGVVPREMPALWPFQALEAQAVAARSYAARVVRLARERDRPYDICATERCQVYGGSARVASGDWIPLEHARTTAAVRSTSGVVMTLAGRPILAEYSSSTGGYTADGPAPYLRPVPDPADGIAPHHVWSVRVIAAEIEEAWPEIGDFRSVRVIERDGIGAWGGRALRVIVAGDAGSTAISGGSFRRALNLRSSWFRLAGAPGGRVVFRVDLREGTRSSLVAALQERLRAEGFFPSGVRASGYFGPITRRAVMAYQRAHRIPATGFVGPLTRRSLNRG